MLFVAITMVVSSMANAGDSYVQSYTRSNGTYVQGYHRTTPDNTVNNNYGTQGNLNPYSGTSGSRPRNEGQSQGVYNQGNGMGSGTTYTTGTGSYSAFGRRH